MSRKGHFCTLTDEQVVEVHRLRNTPRTAITKKPGGRVRSRVVNKMCPRLIANTLGVSEYAVRRELGLSYFSGPASGLVNHPQITIPDFVEQERTRALAYEPDLTAAFFGDPPPWRSALGRRNETRENP